MQSGAAKAKRYRERAEQLRVVSEDLRSESDRKLLLDVAKDYERLAKEAMQ